MNLPNARSSGGQTWHRKSVCSLHHRLGYLFRSARRELGWSDAWIRGNYLARDVACWTKELDSQYAADAEPKRRVLAVHHSNSTAAPQEEDGSCDDTSSIASTQPWSACKQSSRRPRRRTHRRAHRRRKAAEEEDVMQRVRDGSVADLEFDLGLVPMGALGAISECLMESDDPDVEWAGKLVQSSRQQRLRP